MTPRARIIAAVVASAVAVAFVRRPVRPPRRSGTWQPAEPLHSDR